MESLLSAALLLPATGVLAQQADPRLPAQSESPKLAAAESLAQLRANAQASLDHGDWPSAITWSQRFVKAGGAEVEVRPILVHAYVRSADWANAARELQWEIAADERAARAPPEDRLLLLKSCYDKLNDANASSWVLEKLVTSYPRKQYWGELLDRLQKRSDFRGASVDIGRLRLATGAMSTAGEWLQYAADADAAGFPAEAKTAMERGIAAGALGLGADARKHRALLQQYTVAAQAQQKRLGDPKAANLARNGVELVEAGFAYVTLGNMQLGIDMMERAIRQDSWLGGKPQIAKLHLGVAYFLSGNPARAKEIFSSVGGKHGAADLGRLWALHVQRSQSGASRS